MKNLSLLSLALLGLVSSTLAPAADTPLSPADLPAGQNMYVIERDMPGAGKLAPADLKAAAQKSCAVLTALGPEIQWQYSYVTGDKLYCVYLAPNEELIREHARKGGFPANAVNRVTTIISPKTAQ